MTIAYEELRDAVAGSGIGVRTRTSFEPLGGAGDKLQPPTYGSGGKETKYAIEQRTINGEVTKTVVLDSVASQANRLELALLEATRDGDLDLPLISVDFGAVEDLADLDRISSLEASHRVFDALLRDSLLGETLFRLSDVGVAITEANVKNAAALFHHSPTTLVFGGWDSTGPKGGRGAKYERALTSEIIGTGAISGVRTSSRIDPVGIELKAGTIYEAEPTSSTPGWTQDPDEAVQEKGKPKAYSRSSDKPGRPSQINHGNVTPSIDREAGGVTVEDVTAITVLSFIQLRRLRFPVDTKGNRLEGDARRQAEIAARTALAALGLAATTLAFEEGFDLRSRCVLVPNGDISFELMTRGAAEPTTFSLDRESAIALLKTAQEKVAAVGLAWQDEEILLQPTDRLTNLIRRSRDVAAVIAPEEAGEA